MYNSLLLCIDVHIYSCCQLAVAYRRAVNALVYYGLSLNTENLAGDPYLNFCIAGAVEIPAYVLCILVLNRVGRRIPLVVSMVIGGVACIASGCLPNQHEPGMQRRRLARMS